ncbi:glycosyltransferase family 2 protein [Thermoanaerobacteraceae bacterium SP2]|nr:glycosyltransferase family 2 protein [Thermoanaerobacteraceae bacterium SP2]
MVKKVQVLLSSYNGQEYIGQQLDSILNQQGVEVHCLVRDDGSTDSTINILRDYQRRYENIEVIEGVNIGYKKSFMELVYLSGEHNYYAFADQDDVWKPEKMLRAIEKLSEENDNRPAMYCSNCIITDQNLNKIRMLHNSGNIVPETKVQALVQGFAQGCTMVFNRKARDLILKYKPKQDYAHDFWIPLILNFLGKIIYDKNSYILYRQHEDNYFGTKSSIKKAIKFKSVLFNRKRNFYSNMIAEILEGYRDILGKDDRLMLENIISYRNSIVNKAKLILNRQLKRNTFAGTLFIKILIFFSRF